MHLDVVTSLCSKHGLVDHVEEKSGRLRCKKCRYEYVQARRVRVKEKALEYKGNSCCKCGYGRCKKALEFHHVDPSEKDFELSSKWHNKSWDLIKAELDKCILVCANCHREIHDGLIEA